MICAIWGAFLISLVVLVVAQVFDLKKQQKKAMCDIQVTRKATHSIALGIKFFLLKKRYYLTMLKIKPEVYQHSQFIKQLKSKVDTSNFVVNKSPIRSELGFDERHDGRKKRRRVLEIIQYNQMNHSYKLLQQELDEFNEQRAELKLLQDSGEHEILLTNRLLKNEVIEMAETIDQMSETIIKQDTQNKDIKKMCSNMQ